MDVILTEAFVQDCEHIREMQILGFKALLEKYEDYETNPGAESLEKIEWRFSFPNVKHYFIRLQYTDVGYIRIQKLNENTCRLSQMFILPEYQGKKYAQQAIAIAEKLYPEAKKWELDTIKQEQKLCYLYEKMGYKLTGQEKNIKDGMDLVSYEKRIF